MIVEINKAGCKRKSAGRKADSGQHKEPTSVMRVPESQKGVISDFLTAYPNKQKQSSTNAVNEFEIWGVVIGSFRRFRQV